MKFKRRSRSRSRSSRQSKSYEILHNLKKLSLVKTRKVKPCNNMEGTKRN